MIHPWRKIPVMGVAVLLALHGGASFAQVSDPERAAIIRQQLSGGGAARKPDDPEIAGLRTEIGAAIDSIAARLVTIEQEMVDIKSRLKVLEARPAPAGNRITGPAPPAQPPSAAPAPSLGTPSPQR